MNEKITILVNSSDGFEDCWSPFFELLHIFWPNCNHPIMLNTEFKDYHNDKFNIKSSKVHTGVTNRKLTWSECLIEVLKKIDTDILLYLQEDYFIEKSINSKKIDEFIGLMQGNKNIKYIGLTHFGNGGKFTEWQNNDLQLVSQNAEYRISTQAALWDKTTLLSYLRSDENGWMFEIFGTKRAQKRNDLFLTANRSIYNFDNPIIYYEHTGIIKGKWHHRMPELFKNYYITIDFNKRGIYIPKKWLFRKFETTRKLLKNPIGFIKKMLGF